PSQFDVTLERGKQQ
ncbi:unnamed protein product, partial [Rotaria magnacalcarata]